MNWRARKNSKGSGNWKAVSVAFFLTATLGSSGYAQDVRSQQAAIEKEITALNQQITGKQQQMNMLRSRPSPEQAEVASAQRALNDARAQLKAEPSTDNEGKVRNAEFKLKLAERSYNKAHADVEALTEDVNRLKQQVAAKQQQIKDLARQNTEAADNQQQKIADKREQELARAKQEAESAQKEIERLKAALAAKETAEAKAAPAKAAPAPTPAPVAPVKAAAPAPVAAAVPATPAPTPATAPAAPTATGGVIKLSSQQQVLGELQTLAQRAQGGAGRGANYVLYLKKPGASATNKDKVGLRAIGNDQYRGTFIVKPGEYEAVIGFNKWPVHFAADEDGENVFLLDYSDEKKPRLVIYSSRLEGGK
jgi:DNA polymerase III gamma/tau subunit